MYGITLDQKELNANSDLKPLFEYGGGSNIAEMLIDGLKVRCPDGKCAGGITEQEFMPWVYECAINHRDF